MGNASLSGYSVVDFGRGQAVSQATLLLAQLGAEVTKVTVTGESATFPADGEALWNREKSRVEIAEANVDLIADRLSTADILIHDRLPSVARAMGIDPASLDARFPKLVHVAVGAWPAGHPLEESPVADGIALAEAGILDEQEAYGREGPVWLRFPLGSVLAAYLAASGALARVHARFSTGRGGPVFTSLVQGAMLPMMMHWSSAEAPTRSILFGMPKNSGATLFECGDGKWIHTMGAPQQAPAIATALAEMPTEDRARYNAKYADAIVKYPGLGDEWGAVEAIFKTRPHEEWLHILWDADVPAQPILPMGALYFDEQVRANDYVVEGDAEGRPLLLPGAPFQVTTAAASPSSARAGGGVESLRSPLAGVKVLDIGNFLAGPIAPMLLGDLGADVIKLEATSGDPLRPVEWAFNGCQRSKRSIAVQLKDPQGREIMERLVGWADIVHHNQRLPAAAKLGFDWSAVHRLNPSAIYCHVSSYGPRGPRKDWPGYDQLFQASCGWEDESAGEGNPPMWLRFGMIDHAGGLASLLGTLAALVRRDATGEGHEVTASLLGASIASLDCAAYSDGTLSRRQKLDGAQMGVSPARHIYRTSDGWLVIDDSADDADGRVVALAADEGPESWFSSRSTAEGIQALGHAGIAAATVAIDNGKAFLADRDNAALGLSVTVQHPIYGRYTAPGGSWGFGDLALQLDRPIPVLGEHTTELMDMLGYTWSEQDQLAEAKVIKRN